jgi:hypothetical protein
VHITAELEAAIEGLYSAFESYPLPRFTNPCACCHSPIEADAKLRSKPLRLLEAEDLRDYASDAINVWGDVLELKHFLPRILELLATTDRPTYDFVDPQMVLNKLLYAHWREWPADEQASVEHYLQTLWRIVVSYPPAPDSIDDIEGWLCAIAQCEDDLSVYLDMWIAVESLTASLALASFLRMSAILSSKNAGRNAFWSGRDEQYRQLSAWVKTPAVKEKLQRAIEHITDADVWDEFAAALGMLP